jgi:hypothetical protein
VIDVKEPARGPLGCADARVWEEVRAVVPRGLPVSVALGELIEWTRAPRSLPGPEEFAGIAYRKLGLAGAGPRWEEDWGELRGRLGPGPEWIAVVYADWEHARAPHPDAVREAAIAAPDCAGILVDTWDKAQPSPLLCHQSSMDGLDLQAGCLGSSRPLAGEAPRWRPRLSHWSRRAGMRAATPGTLPATTSAGQSMVDAAPGVDAAWRQWFAAARRGRPMLLALAGGLDRGAIVRLALLGPELFAVRGAACAGGDREGTVERHRVAALVRVIKETSR